MFKHLDEIEVAAALDNLDRNSREHTISISKVQDAVKTFQADKGTRIDKLEKTTEDFRGIFGQKADLTHVASLNQKLDSLCPGSIKTVNLKLDELKQNFTSVQTVVKNIPHAMDTLADAVSQLARRTGNWDIVSLLDKCGIVPETGREDNEPRPGQISHLVEINNDRLRGQDRVSINGVVYVTERVMTDNEDVYVQLHRAFEEIRMFKNLAKDAFEVMDSSTVKRAVQTHSVHHGARLDYQSVLEDLTDHFGT